MGDTRLFRGQGENDEKASNARREKVKGERARDTPEGSNRVKGAWGSIKFCLLIVVVVTLKLIYNCSSIFQFQTSVVSRLAQSFNRKREFSFCRYPESGESKISFLGTMSRRLKKWAAVNIELFAFYSIG